MTIKKEKQELLYRKMVEEVVDYAIILIDTDGTILSWNRGIEAIQGYKSEEIIGQNISVFYLPSDRQAMLPEKLLIQARKEGRVRHIGRRISKDGTIFWGSVTITALHDETGNVVGFTSITKELMDNDIE